MRVSEIWGSQEQFDAYGQQLMPILADIGIEFSGAPEIFRSSQRGHALGVPRSGTGERSP